ncbi:MAG: nth1 [Polyangiaceae bacterium]|jgi:endonuclease-3|nr:nth1 [Polyangiaceae bacterium]
MAAKKAKKKASPAAPKHPSKAAKLVAKVAKQPLRPAKKPKLADAAQAAELYRVIRERHPDAHCELDHKSPFELIVATVLSAQSTDVMVNKITPELFRRWPGPNELASADPTEVEKVLSKIGMFRQKTKNIVGLAKQLVEKHGGGVPRTLDELVKLPGVGRKTANVVLGVAFGAPEGVVVDTHVQRLSQRLGLTKHTEPVEIEQDLMKRFGRELWDPLSHTLIFHGRRICTAQKPACAACPAQELCPSAFHAELVGRKPKRARP